MTGKFSLEVLSIYRKENSFLIISGSHLMEHLKVMGDSYVLIKAQEMIWLEFVTTWHSMKLDREWRIAMAELDFGFPYWVIIRRNYYILKKFVSCNSRSCEASQLDYGFRELILFCNRIT
jgi:hypothetical protein